MTDNKPSTYTRTELLNILEGEGTPFSKSQLRKAVTLGLIPPPRHASKGKGTLRFAYSETALAHARALAILSKSGKSLTDFKAFIKSASVQKLGKALDLLEQHVCFEADSPEATAKHATVIMQTVMQGNQNASAETVEWLANLRAEINGLAGIPVENLTKSWMTWIAQTRAKLEEHNSGLRSATQPSPVNIQPDNKLGATDNG